MTWVIGLTGGVGCGKSTIIQLMEQHFNCRSILTDEVSRMQMEPGGIVYQNVVCEFGESILKEGGTIDRKKLAALVFSDANKLERLNMLTHPPVTEYVLAEVQKERAAGWHDYLLIETALLIEGGYHSFCDQVWYVYAPDEQRRERLKKSRGYSDQKITELFARQKTEKEFRNVATAVIDNQDGITQDNILKQLKKLCCKAAEE